VVARDDYLCVGSGEHAVIVLHGWFGSAKAWQPLWRYLDRDAFSYVFPDYRGYGARRGVPGEHTIAELAADTLQAADELGLERFSLVGHSMGGSVMQRVYADNPGRIRALVGISPVPASGVPFDDESWQLFSSAAEEPASRRALIAFTTGSRLTGTWLDAMVEHSLQTSDKDAFAEYLVAWGKTDFHADIEGSDIPVKVIVGEHDPALGEQTARATFGQWYPRLDLEVFPNAGHYAMDETPVALATAIERFLAAV
jgi:pimeloyl-ACP methyl ester carboxylesterase